MKYIQLNNTDLDVSRICLGTAGFGDKLDQEKSFEVLDAFIRAGGNFIDTANVYCKWLEGHGNCSEQIIGKWLKDRGAEGKVIVATKGAHYSFEDPGRSRVNREDIRADLDESCRTLGKDEIDFYWLHRDDPEKPVEEIVDILEELKKEGFADEAVNKYLSLFEKAEGAENGLVTLCDTLIEAGFLEEEVKQNLTEIIDSVEATKAADFKMVFDPTLVRGMGYYTGTIFEIAMPEFGGSCGGGGRYDKMVGRFTGNDVPACGFSIGFERIILLLLESGFKIPGQAAKKAYLIEKGYPADKLQEVIAQAQKERSEGTQVLVVRMNKNKKFQKEKLTAEGYEEFVEFFNR